MDVLIRYGFTIDEIQIMMDTNDQIEEIKDQVIYELIDILLRVGCSEMEIKGIFLCNPFCLTRGINEINNLIKKLYEIGCSHLSFVFDSNPYLLNMSDEEIEQYYQNKLSNGVSKGEIIDQISYGIIL